MLAISLDGRLAPTEGGAAQLGGEGDRRALEQALAWADACLIGAGTLRAHQCTCLIRNPQLLEQRRQQGRPAQPAAVVVSRSPNFPQDWLFFRQPLQRWLLAPAPVGSGFERWIPLAESWPERLTALALLGVQRLVLLGGAQLTADLLAADCVDALQLTLAPRLMGGATRGCPQPVRACLKHSPSRRRGMPRGQNPLEVGSGCSAMPGSALPQVGECRAEGNP